MSLKEVPRLPQEINKEGPSRATVVPYVKYCPSLEEFYKIEYKNEFQTSYYVH